MILRRNLPTITVLGVLSFAILTSSADAQGIRLDPDSHLPVFGIPLQGDSDADTYKRLPYRDMPGKIHIEVAASALYDFDQAKVPASAADYMQQAANLIFEHANGPVRVECRSDRLPAATAQKLAERCALAVSQWLTVQEKLTRVKFITVGTSVPPPGAPDAKDPFAPKPVSQSHIVIDFAKK